MQKLKQKLGSRKLWISIIIIMYGVIMGIRSLNMDNQVVTIVYTAAAAVAGVAYVLAEALVDGERIYAEGDEGDEGEDAE